MSTKGLLSITRPCSIDSTSPLLQTRAPHREGVHALVVPQQGPHVVGVDVDLREVLPGDAGLAVEAPGCEEEALQRVPRDGDVLRDLLPEPLMEDAEVAPRDVVEVLVVLLGDGPVRRAQPADRVPDAHRGRVVAALLHRVDVPDDVPVHVRDRHVRERGHVPLDAVRGAALPHGDVERGPAHVRLLTDPVREVLADPLPELDHAVRARLLDEVLDQRHERDVQHGDPRSLRSPHTKDFKSFRTSGIHSRRPFSAADSPAIFPTSSVTSSRNRVQCASVMYGAEVPTSLSAIVRISSRGPMPTAAWSLFFTNPRTSMFFLYPRVSSNFSTNSLLESFFSSCATSGGYARTSSSDIPLCSSRCFITDETFSTFFRSPSIAGISRGFAARNTRNALSPTPLMMIVPTSYCWTLSFRFWELSCPQMSGRFPFTRLRRWYCFGSRDQGTSLAKIRPSTPRNRTMSRPFSWRARFSSVSSMCLRRPTDSASIVLSTLPARDGMAGLTASGRTCRTRSAGPLPASSRSPRPRSSP